MKQTAQQLPPRVGANPRKRDPRLRAGYAEPLRARCHYTQAVKRTIVWLALATLVTVPVLVSYIAAEMYEIKSE